MSAYSVIHRKCNLLHQFVFLCIPVYIVVLEQLHHSSLQRMKDGHSKSERLGTMFA